MVKKLTVKKILTYKKQANILTIFNICFVHAICMLLSSIFLFEWEINMSGMIDKIFDSSVQGLHKNLDITKKRSEALLSNIANVETPGYRAVDVNFGKELDRAFKSNSGVIKTTSEKHMNIEANSGVSHVVADNTGTMKKDGNNVDLDLQMAKMSKNSGSFKGSAAMIRKKLDMLKQAIRFAQR